MACCWHGSRRFVFHATVALVAVLALTPWNEEPERAGGGVRLAMGQAESPLIGQGIDPFTSNVVSEPVPVYLSVMLRKLITVDELKYSYSAYFQVVTSWRDPRVNNTLGVMKVMDQFAPDLVADAMSNCKPNVTFAGFNISQKSDCIDGFSQTGLPQLKDCKKPCTPAGTRCCDGVWLPSLNIPNVIFFPQDRYATVTVESGNIYLVTSNSGRQQEQASKGLSGGGGGGFSSDEVTGWRISRVGLNCSASSSNTAVSDLANYAQDDPWAQVSSSGGAADPSKPTTCVFVISISRTSGVYVLSVILPVMLSVYLTFSVFFAKPEDLEVRSATCVTLFLALAAVQFVIDSQIEKDVVASVSKRFTSRRDTPPTPSSHDTYNTLSVELMKSQPPPPNGGEGGSETSAEERNNGETKPSSSSGQAVGPSDGHGGFEKASNDIHCNPSVWPWGCLHHCGYRYKSKTEGHEDEDNYKLAVAIDAVCFVIFFVAYTIVCIVLYVPVHSKSIFQSSDIVHQLASSAISVSTCLHSTNLDQSAASPISRKMALLAVHSQVRVAAPVVHLTSNQRRSTLVPSTAVHGASRSSIVGTSLMQPHTVSEARCVAVLQQRAPPAVAATPMEVAQKGWSYSQYGSAVRDLQFGTVPLPEVAPDQVLINVSAAALNPIDIKRMRGAFKETDSPLPTVPGYDVAGTVVAVGSAVTKFAVGDRVFGDINEFATLMPKQLGSLARFTAAEERLLAKIPNNMSFAEAAAVPMVALTALGALEAANFKHGQSVLILNGAGGVGSMAIQVAKRVFGAGFVATTASLPKVGLLEALGADHVEDYRAMDYTRLPQLYDCVLDCVGEAERAMKVVKPGGAYVCLTGSSPAPAVRFNMVSSGAKLQQLLPFFARGELRAVIDPHGVFALFAVPSAFEHLESGRATGKVVVGVL
ncbi:unnamed protein product [Closterium sp. NIES-54]